MKFVNFLQIFTSCFFSQFSFIIGDFYRIIGHQIDRSTTDLSRFTIASHVIVFRVQFDRFEIIMERWLVFSSNQL